MVEVNSKKELDEIQKNSPFSVTMYRSDNCGHCVQTHPVVEQRCNDVKGAVPVIDCPMDKKFCVNKIKEMGESGIPLVVGIKNGDMKNPAFVVRGAQIDKINHNFDILRQWKDEAVQASGQVPDARPSDEQYMIPDQGNQSAISAMLGLRVGAPRERGHVANLCTPGFDCSMEDFNNAAVEFMLASKGNREPSRT